MGAGCWLNTMGIMADSGNDKNKATGPAGRSYPGRTRRRFSLNESLLQIIQSIPDPLTVIEAETGIALEANHQFHLLTGYKREETIGHTARDLNLWVVPEERNKLIEGIKGQGFVEELEADFRRKDGSVFTGLMSARLINIKGTKCIVTITKDISQRKALQVALAESESRYRHIFENIQDVFYQVDNAGLIREISPSIVRYSGFTREELIGRPVEKVYKNPEDRKKMMMDLMEKGELADYDVELCTRSGEVRWASLHIHLKKNEDGSPAEIEGSLRDVTKRKVAEEALRESEEKFRGLAEFTPYAIMIYQDDRWVYANRAATQISGYSEKEILGMNFWEFVDDEFREVVKERGQNRQTGSPAIASYELKIITKAGESRWVYLSGSTIRYNGKPAGMISVIDINDRKRDELIQQLLYEISNAVSSTRDLQELVWIIHRELGKLIESPSFYIAFYDSTTGLLSTPYNQDEVDHIEVWPADRSLTGLVIQKNAPLLLTKSQILEMNRQGTIDIIGSMAECWLGVPLHEENLVSGALVVRSYTNPKAYSQRDVEMLEFIADQISLSIRRKKTEEELKSALEKARESEQLKSVFLANMSHEIRTPMNAILGFSDLNAQPDITDEERTFYTGIIRNAGSRLMHIIDDIIDLSKLEAGQIQISQAGCHVGKMLRTIQESHLQSSLLAKKKGLTLQLALPEGAPLPLILTDCGRVQQVLDNLITNAIKYTETGNIRFGYTLEESPSGRTVRFFVSDTGKGIPRGKLNLIFERFRQVDEFGYHEGAGLGLSISRMLAELLGGTISVESEEGKGSTFWFTIPFNPATEPQNPQRTRENEKIPDLTGKTILIAEDDQDAFTLLSLMLERTHATIIHAADGQSLMAMLEHMQPEFIFLDINMPGKTGFDCLKEIREKKLPISIIVQTAYAMADERQRCLDAGADAYLAKPFARPDLYKTIIPLIAP